MEPRGPDGDRRTILLKDAPVHSALELVRRGFGLPAFVIDPRVQGTLTASLHSQTLEQAMDRLCASGEPKLEWARAGARLIRVRPRAGVPPRAASRKARATGVQITRGGLLNRVCGILESGSDAWALVVVAAVPNKLGSGSGMLPVYFVRAGDNLGPGYRVKHIGHEGVILSGPRMLKIPFVGLAR